jgi:hypothetical protein
MSSQMVRPAASMRSPQKVRLANACLVLLLCWFTAPIACVARSELPAALSDQEFWELIEQLSEPAGTFTVSENFVSNEPHVAANAGRLRPSAGVYIGVGPEQNFSYIARLRPAMAFIIDIRRENRNLHLFYKALFELSTDRADFVSRLFSRPRPADLQATVTVEELFRRYDGVRPSAELYSTTAALVRERLLIKRGFPLTPGDLEWIDRASKAFFADGPAIQFWGSQALGAESVPPSYRQLMTARDYTGQSRSFLSAEDAFRFVKDLHSRNMLVPVVGDFAGHHTLRAVGDHIHRHADVVRAFYGSNVGVYLNSDQTRAFCGNLARLPAARGSWFIESKGVRTLASKLRACAGPRQ